MKYSILSICLLSSFTSIASANTASTLKTAPSRMAYTRQATKIKSESLAVTFKAQPNAELLAWVKRIPGVTLQGPLVPGASQDYFKRTYKIHVKANAPKVLAQLVSSSQVANVESIGTVDLYTVTPSTAKPETNDPLVNYQWALKSSGQTILKEIDDINDEVFKADPKGPSMDIGAFAARAKIASLKRDVVVAVIDSGADLTHPDLLPNIYKNEKECVDGLNPFPATEDKDGNGFKGDCMGWNFSGRKPEGTNDADDNTGHGTHVSGIMAAVSGNGLGVAGVSNRIKVLPIKVTGQSTADEEEEIRVGEDGKPLPPREGRKEVGFADRVANAILYAVKMKVDVINMSLGWPISVDAEFLREAFSEARKAGIVIVAAAGNNTSGIPVFPCSYNGVICVGSVSINGQVSSFSNFGGQVDMMGPGEEILSTIPTVLDSAVFAVSGYDLKNGTSQAAPYVSAQAALLRGLNPGISADQVLARLSLGSKPVKWGAKYGMNGSPDIERALSVKPQPAVRPVFKDVSQIPFIRSQKSFKFSLPIKNYWLGASGVKVSIRLDERHLSLDTSNFDLGSIGEGESKTLTISGKILDLEKPREAKLTVQISATGQPAQSFSQQLYLTRRLENDSEVKTHPIVFAQDKPKLVLETVRSVREDDEFPHYYSSEATDKGLLLTIVRMKNGKYEVENPIMLPNAVGAPFGLRVDLNYDGKTDYLFATPMDENGEKFMSFTMFKEDFSPIVEGQMSIPLQIDGGIIRGRALQYPSFMQFDTPKGKIAGFIFNDGGFIPEKDLNPDKLEWEVNTSRERTYVYEPRIEDGKMVFTTVNFDNYLWSENIANVLKPRAREDVEIANLLPQTDADFAKGILRALVKIGSSTLKRYKLMTITGGAQMVARQFSLSDVDFDDQTFEGSDLRATINLDRSIPEHLASPAFGTLFTLTKGRSSSMDPTGAKIVNTTHISPSRPQDHLMGFLQTYTQGDSLVSFFQSKSQLIVRDQSSKGAIQDQQPIDRTSMIPDFLFVPSALTSGIGAKKTPALYMDSTLVLAKRLFIWNYKDGKLTSPMLMNVEIPDGCQALEPRRFGKNGETAYVLLCRDEAAKQWALKTLTVH